MKPGFRKQLHQKQSLIKIQSLMWLQRVKLHRISDTLNIIIISECPATKLCSIMPGTTKNHQAHT